MTNKICENCRHWKKFTDAHDIKYHGPHAGSCSTPKIIYEEQNIPADSLAYWDHEGYHADFCTGEAFGCIHWEQKP